MRDDVATQRYLERHIEPDLPEPPARKNQLPLWEHVLVIPAYRESSTLLQRLKVLGTSEKKTLVILVINRPNSDADTNANESLRAAVNALQLKPEKDQPAIILPISDSVDLYVYDQEIILGPNNASEGVGLARKTGCDIAFKWISQGTIQQPWIHCTDADATLPPDYFARTEQLDANTVAVLSPFTHTTSEDDSISFATTLYELRLHHYALGLQFAGSPYGFHTLGSCLQIRAGAYAHCRGFPKRSGGEDFYLLNKLRKLGDIKQLDGKCIELATRDSSRVPFGTGPAVAAIVVNEQPLDARLFYHPATFLALASTLNTFPQLYKESSLEACFANSGLDKELQVASTKALESLGLPGTIEKFRSQCKSPEQFSAQMHRWFDGFRTLKFLHTLRDEGWPALSLAQTFDIQPSLWPESTDASLDAQTLRSKVYEYLGWNP